MHSWPDPNARWRQTVFRERPLPEATLEEDASPGGRLALLAFGCFMASQVFRWGWWTDVGGHTQDVGYVSQSVNGLAGAVTSAGLALAIRARSGASSGFRLVQLLPVLLGIAALLLGLSGLQQTYTEMTSHQAEGRPAGLDVGLWLGLGGAALALLAGWRATRARLTHPLHRDAALVVQVLAPELAVAAAGMPIWLVAWFLAGRSGGGAVGAVGLLLSPIASLSVWHWVRGDRRPVAERPQDVEVVPMDRLRERGRNR